MNASSYLTILFPWDTPAVGIGSHRETREIHLYIMSGGDFRSPVVSFDYDWFECLSLNRRRDWILYSLVSYNSDLG